MHWQLQKVAARHGRRYYETGQRMPVTIFLGGDPMYTFAATAPLPDGLDEFLLAGYLRRKSIDLVKCETNDLEVPANADFVIEGYIDPLEPLRDEGPVESADRGHIGHRAARRGVLLDPCLEPPGHFSGVVHFRAGCRTCTASHRRTRRVSCRFP